MKTTKNIFLLFFLSLSFIGCKNELDFTPSDQLSNEKIISTPELTVNATIGNYSWLKESNYVRMRHIMQEYPSDNIILSGSTSDNLLYTYNYQHVVNSVTTLNFWRAAYYGIYGTNVIIEGIADNAPDNLKQLKGENLFLRALMHYDLVRVFARPYSQSPETNLGIMIRDNADVTALPARSTVKETYEFIVNDLLEAANLMTDNKSASFASKETAWALLSRMYLYMEQNDKAIEYADKVINSGRYELLSTDKLADYFTFTPENNPETIFAIKHLQSENRNKSSIGSMYHGDGGWGEIYASKTYRDLISKYPNDERNKFIEPDYVLDGNGNKISDPDEDVGFLLNKRNNVSKYFITKYTRQEGIAMLSSPVVLRLAEMYLNKAEAFAKTGNDSEAINMINIIRQRAGLTGDQLFSLGNLKGYPTVLDVVLDERRLELAWEGHRSFDMFRNNKALDRSYVVDQVWSGSKLIQPTSNSIVHFIPDTELTLNPNLVQNP